MRRAGILFFAAIFSGCVSDGIRLGSVYPDVPYRAEYRRGYSLEYGGDSSAGGIFSGGCYKLEEQNLSIYGHINIVPEISYTCGSRRSPRHHRHRK